MKYANTLYAQSDSVMPRLSFIHFVVLSLALALFPLSADAQDKDMQDAMEAKQLVEETAAFEKKLRAELEEDIVKQRRNTLEALKRIAQKYRDKGERGAAREVSAVIVKLEEKLGKDSLVAKPEPEPESDIFEYGKTYLFSSDKIGGQITFQKNGNANAIFKIEGNPQNVVWKFVEKSDHILISNGGDLGRIYVSEVPKSDKRSVMIRLGGKLRHHVITGTIK